MTPDRPIRSVRAQGGFALVELMITAMVVMMGCAALVLSTSSTGLATLKAEQAAVTRNSLEWLLESLADVEYDDLLSWNGVSFDRGDHTARVVAVPVSLGLIRLELTVTDDRTGATLGRLATLRSGGY